MSVPDNATGSARFVSIDHLASHVAVLDSVGTILAVNAAWRRFAEANGASWPKVREGVGYLAVCDAAAAGGDPDAARFATLLRSLLSGELEEFTMEYECHSTAAQRWFVARAMRHDTPAGARVVVKHENITPIRLAFLESEKRRSLFEAVARETPIGIFQSDEHGNVRHYNHYFAERMALLTGDVSNLTWWRILHPMDREIAAACLRDCVADRREATIDLRFLRSDGSTRWATVRIAPVGPGDGIDAAIIGTVVDTTRRKKRELCLAAVSVHLAHLEGEDLYRQALLHMARILEVEFAFLAIPDGKGRAGTIAAVVEGRIVENFEYELAGTPCADVMDASTRVYADGVREAFPSDLVARDLGVDGYAGIALKDPANGPLGILATASRGPLKDAGELPALMHLFGTRLAADLDRRRSEARFHELFEFAPDALLLCDHSGRITEVNKHAEELFGYARSELLGHPLELLALESVQEFHVHLRTEYTQTSSLRAIDRSGHRLEARRRDGSTVPVEISLAPITTAHGSFTIAAVRDATSRHLVELARIEREKLVNLRMAIEDAFAQQAGLSSTTVRAAEHLLHAFDLVAVRIRVQTSDASLPPVDVRVVRDGETLPPGFDVPVDPEDVLALNTPAGVIRSESLVRHGLLPAVGLETEASPFDACICPLHIGERALGSLLLVSAGPWSEEALTGLASTAGVLSAHLGRVSAEAGLRALASELEQRVQERTRDLEVANRDLDSFAASVSHDLRAPIRRIHGFASLLDQSLAGRLEAEDADALHALVATSREMGSIVAALLQVARAGRAPMQTRPIDTGALANEVMRGLLQAAPDRQIEFVVGELPNVSGDLAMIRQVFENLFSNAVKYSRNREVARIELRSGDVHEGRVRLEVRDNGVGFDMAHADRLFEMFQRLHRSEEFEGTGVGLATVQRILSRHGGTIQAESRPGDGTSFTFTLPAG